MKVLHAATLILAALVLSSSIASAQLVTMTHFVDGATHSVHYRAAYDPLHEAYLVTDGVFAQFVDRTGRGVGPTFIIDVPSVPLLPPQTIGSTAAAVVYSPDVSDGAGGLGGFLVVWSHGRTHSGLDERQMVFSQVVSFPGRLVGPRQTVFSTNGGFDDFIMNVDVAYSPLDRLFLIALNYFNKTTAPDQPAWMVRLALDGQPTAQARLSTAPNVTCAHISLSSFFPSSCNVGVAWNPVSHDFGVLYRQQSSVAGGEITIARVRSDLTIVSSTTVLAANTLFSAFAVNATTGHYVVTAGSGASIDRWELGADGTVVGIGPVAPNVDARGPLALSYLPASGTFLFSGEIVTAFGTPRNVSLIELDQHGAPLSPTLTVPTFEVAQAAHRTAREGLVSVSGGSWIIGTNTPFDGSGAAPSSCVTVDPFTSLGGGVCLNGGWLPPGHPLIPSTPPPPTPGGCTSPDPFTSLGGGVCVNGGWVPQGHPLAGGKG